MLRFVIAALCAFTLTVSVSTAQAQDGDTPEAAEVRIIDGVEARGDVTREDIEAARSYKPWGEAFGQDELAYIAVDENKARMMLAFLGDEETLRNWTRMVTINIFGLPEDEAVQEDVVFEYIDGFRNYVAQQKEQGDMAVELKGFAGFTQTPPDAGNQTAAEAAADAERPQRALYHFAIGKDKPDEDNAGIIFPLDGRLINFQVQRRDGKTVSEEEMNQLQNFLMIQVKGGLTPEMRAALENKAAEAEAAAEKTAE